MLEVKNSEQAVPHPSRQRCRSSPRSAFSLQRGDSASIVGPSGSGKSTLLYVIGALEPPTAMVPSRSMGRSVRPRRARAGGVSKHQGRVRLSGPSACLPQCTVLENVLVPTSGGRDRTLGVTDRAVELIEQVGLKEPGLTIVRPSSPGESASGWRWHVL